MTQTVIEGVPVGPDGPVADESQVEVIDYFGFAVTKKYYLASGKDESQGPHDVQYVEYAAMNEGKRKAFQRKVTRDFVVDRKTGDTRVSVDPGTEREQLIRESVTDWYMFRGGKPVPYNSVNLGDFLTLADPTVIEKIADAIREVNPWLLDDVSVEDIDDQIERLEDQKKRLQERDRGEHS